MRRFALPSPRRGLRLQLVDRSRAGQGRRAAAERPAPGTMAPRAARRTSRASVRAPPRPRPGRSSRPPRARRAPPRRNAVRHRRRGARSAGPRRAEVRGRRARAGRARRPAGSAEPRAAGPRSASAGGQRIERRPTAPSSPRLVERDQPRHAQQQRRSPGRGERDCTMPDQARHGASRRGARRPGRPRPARALAEARIRPRCPARERPGRVAAPRARGAPAPCRGTAAARPVPGRGRADPGRRAGGASASKAAWSCESSAQIGAQSGGSTAREHVPRPRTAVHAAPAGAARAPGAGRFERAQPAAGAIAGAMDGIAGSSKKNPAPSRSVAGASSCAGRAGARARLRASPRSLDRSASMSPSQVLPLHEVAAG